MVIYACKLNSDCPLLFKLVGSVSVKVSVALWHKPQLDTFQCAQITVASCFQKDWGGILRLFLNHRSIAWLLGHSWLCNPCLRVSWSEAKIILNLINQWEIDISPW